MEIIGIICEYNPFHSGHKYHIDKIKEMYPDSIIIGVFSSCFTERGTVSVLNKWDKTNIALLNGIDLVLELPFVYSSQSADIFSKGALKILASVGVNTLVFGSESNDIELLESIASLQINNKDFDMEVKKELSLGSNYPTSLSKAIKKFNLKNVDSPNDLLGISYIKEIIRNDYKIKHVSIKRSNNYHGNNKGSIKSASEIRDMIGLCKNIKSYINYDESLIYKNIDLFPLLKYKIISNINNLNKYQTVDEGIEGRIKKYIDDSNSLEELVLKIKTKRYTYNKINRMLIHILTSFTKEEAKLDLDYIRILGFNNNGKNYLNKIKKEINIPLITSYKDVNSKMLDIEYRVSKIYSIIVKDNSLIKRELKRPIVK